MHLFFLIKKQLCIHLYLKFLDFNFLVIFTKVKHLNLLVNFDCLYFIIKLIFINVVAINLTITIAHFVFNYFINLHLLLHQFLPQTLSL